MNASWRSTACLMLFAAFVVPVVGQTKAPPKIVPKLDPIAETRLLMEGLAHSNFRGLERNLNKNPIDDQSWAFARGQALLIAETANLLMLRPPRTQGEAVWFDRAMDLRKEATNLAVQLTKKDVELGKSGLMNLSRSCNRCHQSFKVPIDIVPFQPQEPPGRKI